MSPWALAQVPQEPPLPGHSRRAGKGGVWLEDSGLATCQKVDAGNRENKYRTTGLMLKTQTLRRKLNGDLRCAQPGTYLRFPVLENGSIHSSLDNIRCEKSFFSGSIQAPGRKQRGRAGPGGEGPRARPPGLQWPVCLAGHGDSARAIRDQVDVRGHSCQALAQGSPGAQTCCPAAMVSLWSPGGGVMQVPAGLRQQVAAGLWARRRLPGAPELAGLEGQAWAAGKAAPWPGPGTGGAGSPGSLARGTSTCCIRAVVSVASLHRVSDGRQVQEGSGAAGAPVPGQLQRHDTP